MKRLFFQEMRQFDLDNLTSHVREIEMLVDSITGFDGYSMQFWQDVRVYGLREACIYLRNNGYTLTTELVSICSKLGVTLD